MPTPNDFRQVLRQLANHLHHLQAELYDTGLPAARQSQTGARTTTVKGRPPCDLTIIDTIEHTPINQDGPTPGPSIRGWAYNLAADTPTPTPLPTNQPLATWCAWLNRHANQLAEMPWAAEAYDELHDIETTLRHQLNPTNPHLTAAIAKDKLGTPTQTARWASSITGKRIDRRKITYLAKTDRINTYVTPDGNQEYSLKETLEALENFEDNRTKKSH